MRAKFGIAADGTMVDENKNPLASNESSSQSKTLAIPDVEDLVRVGPGSRPSREQAANSEFVIGTKEHIVSGDTYLVLTDHTDVAFLESLGKLVEHRSGKLIELKDLADLSSDQTLFNNISEQIKRNKAKYVVIAPRMESFSENTVLAFWELLSTIDPDPQLDCYPGILVASNAKSFANLIDQSIAHKPVAPKQLKPFAISQVQNSKDCLLYTSPSPRDS